MAGEINWKQKYQELKSKYMSAVDMAFRLGVEEGMKQSQLDQANQQLAQAQAAAQGGMGPDQDAGMGEQPGGKENNNGAPGVPDQGAGPDKSGAPSVQPEPVQGAPMAESEHPEGSELDQHIAKLESIISKSEFSADDLKKSLEDLRSFRANMVMQSELKKSAQAIPAIAKALHKPAFKFGVNARHNLDSTAKAASTMHQKIVSDIMEKWEQEENKSSKDILSTLKVEGILKGE